MFKSITYLRSDYENMSFIYKLVDTEFECSPEAPMAESSWLAVGVAMIVKSAYEERNFSHNEIVKNLFKCNLYLCNKYKYSFEEVLAYQNILIDKHYKDINFSKLYYEDLKGMWDKYKVFI